MTRDNRADEYKWAENFGFGIKALESGNLPKAVRCLSEAASIAEKLELAEPLSNTLIALGDAYRLSEDYGNAEINFKKAINFSNRFADDRIPYAFSNAALGRLYIEQEKVIEAKTALETAATIFKRNRSTAEPEFVSAFIALITCYLLLSDFDQADKLSEYTVELSKEVLGASDPATIMLLNLWASSAEERGKTKKAAEIRAQIAKITGSADDAGADLLDSPEDLLEALQETDLFAPRRHDDQLSDDDIENETQSEEKQSDKKQSNEKPKRHLRAVE